LDGLIRKNPPMIETQHVGGGGRKGILDLVEWIGNKLPDPAVLFLIGAAVVMLASQIAVSSNWTVHPKKAVNSINAETGEPTITFVDDETKAAIQPVSLLTTDGLYWCLTSMVTNFMDFAPLGIVLTGMMGIGVAERTGLIGALLKAFMKVVPNTLLTPTMLFLGIMSSMGLDAGYVVLPPLAAALYKSVGRSPLAGIAAVFAGVAAGFNANLLITGLDPMLANLSQIGARVLDPDYSVAATCNWWFAICSTFFVTLMGWGVSSWFVERRLNKKSAEDGGPTAIDASDLEASSSRPMRNAVSPGPGAPWHCCWRSSPQPCSSRACPCTTGRSPSRASPVRPGSLTSPVFRLTLRPLWIRIWLSRARAITPTPR